MPREGCHPRLEGVGHDPRGWGTESAGPLPQDHQGAASKGLGAEQIKTRQRKGKFPALGRP